MERTVTLLNLALNNVHEAAFLIELLCSIDEPEQREKKNRELERINKIFVGKELRMAELKERNKMPEERVEGSMKR